MLPRGSKEPKRTASENHDLTPPTPPEKQRVTEASQRTADHSLSQSSTPLLFKNLDDRPYVPHLTHNYQQELTRRARAKERMMAVADSTITTVQGSMPLQLDQVPPHAPLAVETTQPDGDESRDEPVEKPTGQESDVTQKSDAVQNSDAISESTNGDAQALSSPKTDEADRDLTFYGFVKLPAELRESVYGLILVSDKPIVPSICECARRHRDEVKFHDANGYIADGTYGYGHGRVHTALTNIIVSKQFYSEALKIFYSSNTFAFGADVPTYFERLSHLGRFDMVKHVTLPVYFIDEKVGKKIIETLAKNLEDQAAFEDSYKMKRNDVTHGSLPLKMVKAHPMFHAAGLEYLGPFFMLQKLSAAYVGLEYERELVLGVQTPDRFKEFEYTTWFLKVAESLGIKIKLVQEDTSANLPNIHNAVHVEWKQKYQKAHLENSELRVLDKTTVSQKGLDIFANHNGRALPRATSYMRKTCREAVEWYRVRCADDDERQSHGTVSLARHRENAIQVWEQWFRNGEPTPPPSPRPVPLYTPSSSSEVPPHLKRTMKSKPPMLRRSNNSLRAQILALRDGFDLEAEKSCQQADFTLAKDLPFAYQESGDSSIHTLYGYQGAGSENPASVPEGQLNWQPPIHTMGAYGKTYAAALAKPYIETKPMKTTTPFDAFGRPRSLTPGDTERLLGPPSSTQLNSACPETETASPLSATGLTFLSDIDSDSTWDIMFDGNQPDNSDESIAARYPGPSTRTDVPARGSSYHNSPQPYQAGPNENVGGSMFGSPAPKPHEMGAAGPYSDPSTQRPELPRLTAPGYAPSNTSSMTAPSMGFAPGTPMNPYFNPSTQRSGLQYPTAPGYGPPQTSTMPTPFLDPTSFPPLGSVREPLSPSPAPRPRPVASQRSGYRKLGPRPRTMSASSLDSALRARAPTSDQELDGPRNPWSSFSRR